MSKGAKPKVLWQSVLLLNFTVSTDFERES